MARSGDTVTLVLVAEDLGGSVHPQIDLLKQNGSPVSTENFSFVSGTRELYQATFTMPSDTEFVHGEAIIYDDSGHTTPTSGVATVPFVIELENDLAQSEILSDATPFAGANIDAAISSRESESSAATRATTNQTEHDATQAAIAALNNPTAAAIAAEVWDETLSDHTTSGSTGEKLNQLGVNVLKGVLSADSNNNLQGVMQNDSNNNLFGILEDE